MKLSLVTLALDPTSGAFPSSPLEGIDGEVISVVEHFFHHGGLPHLLLVVHHRPASGPGRPKKTRGRPPSPRDELAEPERELFDRLRAWRAGRAQADGVPPYVLLTNRQLADLARTRPATRKGMRDIVGIGEAKANKLGAEVLAVIHAEVAPAGTAPEEETPVATSGSVDGEETPPAEVAAPPEVPDAP